MTGRTGQLTDAVLLLRARSWPAYVLPVLCAGAVAVVHPEHTREPGMLPLVLAIYTALGVGSFAVAWRFGTGAATGEVSPGTAR